MQTIVCVSVGTAVLFLYPHGVAVPSRRAPGTAAPCGAGPGTAVPRRGDSQSTHGLGQRENQPRHRSGSCGRDLPAGIRGCRAAPQLGVLSRGAHGCETVHNALHTLQESSGPTRNAVGLIPCCNTSSQTPRVWATPSPSVSAVLHLPWKCFLTVVSQFYTLLEVQHSTFETQLEDKLFFFDYLEITQSSPTHKFIVSVVLLRENWKHLHHHMTVRQCQL